MVNFLEYKAPGGKSKIIRGRDCNNKGRAHEGKMEVSKSSFEAYDTELLIEKWKVPGRLTGWLLK